LQRLAADLRHAPVKREGCAVGAFDQRVHQHVVLGALLRAADHTALAQGTDLASDHRFDLRGERRDFRVLRVVSAAGDRRLICSIWQDMAPQRQREAQLRLALDQLEQQQKANDALRLDLSEQGLRDQASGLNSRAHFDDQMRRELDLSTREHREFALVYMALDPFNSKVGALGLRAQERICEAIVRVTPQVVAATGSTSGDVSIQSTGNIVALANQTNIQGRKLILESLYGTIGTAATAIRIQTAATGGSVKATASGDIRLTQLSGDLQIDSIDSAAGNVTVNVPQGKVLNVRNQTTAQTLSQEQIERVWADLRLTADSGASSRQTAAVTGYQNQVATQYRRYWQLLGNGSVSGGSYRLAQDSVKLYLAQAAAALGKAAAATTDA
jgi:hypothetical protein